MRKATVYSVIAVCLLIIISTVFVYIAPHIGWSFDSISSGSMEPYIPVGAMVVTKPVDVEDIHEGDVITFYPVFWQGNMMVHRVVEVDPGPPVSFVTQGDANLSPDPQKVYAENLFGKVILTISGLGHFIDFVKDIKGFIFMIIVPNT